MKSIKLLTLFVFFNFSLSAQDGIYLFGQMNNAPGIEMDVDITIYSNPSVSTTLTIQSNGDIPTTWVDLPSAEWNYLEASFVDCTDTISTQTLYEDSTNGLIDVYLELDYCLGGDIYGCTMFNADNYNPNATVDDGSCYFSDCEVVFSNFYETCGLIFLIAQPAGYSYTWTVNGEPNATENGWMYYYPDGPGTYEFCAQMNYNGCEDQFFCETIVIEEACETECAEFTLDVEYNIGDNPCAIYVSSDAEQPEADVWDMGDGSDLIYYSGETAIDYVYAANGEYEVCGTFYYDNCISQSCYTVVIDNCGEPVTGCTDPEALNFNPEATLDDGSCEYAFECTISFTVSPDTTGAQVIWITPSVNIYDADSIERDFGDGNTSNDLFPVHSYEGDGPYTLCLTATFEDNGTTCEISHCVELSDEMINPPGMQSQGFSINVVDPLGTTGVNDIEWMSELTLWPNPAKELVQIQFELHKTTDVNLELYDAIGQMVAHSNFPSHSGNNVISIDVADLKPGMYFLRLNGNNEQMTSRLIVH